MDYINVKELLELAETISLLGTWELDLQTNHLIWSNGVFRMCGYQPNEFEVTLESGLALIHPEDRALAVEKMKNAIEKGTPYEIRERLIKKNKQIIHILSKGKIINDDDGKPIKLFGVFQDITSAVKMEEEYESAINDLESRNDLIETIVENLPIGVSVKKISSGKTPATNSSFAAADSSTYKDLKDVDVFFKKVGPEEAYQKEIIGRVRTDFESSNSAKMNWNNHP